MGGNDPYLATHRTPHLTLGRKRGCGGQDGMAGVPPQGRPGWGDWGGGGGGTIFKLGKTAFV